MMQEKPKCKSYFNARKKITIQCQKTTMIKKNDEDT